MDLFKKWLSDRDIKVTEAKASDYVKFALKTKEEYKVIEIDSLDAEQSANLYSEYASFMQKTQNELIESKASKADLEEIKDLLLKEQERQVANLTDTIRKQAQINAESSKPKASVKNEPLHEQVEQKMPEIKAAIQKGVEIELPFFTAKATFTTASAIDNQDVHHIERIADLPSRRTMLYDMFTKNTVSVNENGTVSYDDYDDTSVRGADTYAENTPVPESTAVMQNYTATLKKIGDSISMTEEAMYDSRRFTDTLQRFVLRNVALEVDTQLATGNGLTTNLTGILTRVNAYTPTASGITDANIYDLINVLSTDIESRVGGSYMANMLLMNVVDFTRFFLQKKDANNNYLLAPWARMIGPYTIDVNGVIVQASSAITQGQLVIGDRLYATIYEQPGLILQRGLKTGDFENDRISMKVRRRMLFLIRNADLEGFWKITDIGAALTTLATP